MEDGMTKNTDPVGANDAGKGLCGTASHKDLR
jgi:hypothetical protein